MDDEGFMAEALKEARIALELGNWPIGCVIVLDGKIIARAHNQVYSHRDKTAHAEMRAIQQVQDILHERRGEATLYTTYEPCPMCFGAIILSGIKRVVGGVDLDQSGSMFLRDHLPILFKQSSFHVEFDNGVLARECHDVFIQGKPTAKLLDAGIIRRNSQVNI